MDKSLCTRMHKTSMYVKKKVPGMCIQTYSALYNSIFLHVLNANS